MTASMQAVIQKLRDQEKELGATSSAGTERAQQTERLSEAVTSNMPAGIVAGKFRGADFASSNPAAEAALGARSLAFRRYGEVFGPGSPVTRDDRSLPGGWRDFPP